MKYQAENAISSFFYYMWNAWNEEECKVVYGDMHRHFWEKWCQMTDKGVFGAAERFYAELTDHYREKLAERAVALYDGKARRKEQNEELVYVCAACGSILFEATVWINTSTGGCMYVYDNDDGCSEEWCGECGWTMTGNGKSITNITLTTKNNMQKDIISLICNSCGCNGTEAQEHLDSELRHLRELQELDDLRENDIEVACLNLGLDLDWQEYFINRLAGA